MLHHFNFRTQRKRLKIALLGALLVNFSQLATSALTQGAANQPNGEIQLRLRNATSTLDTLETALNTIEKQKIVTLSETDKISQSTLEYAKTVKSALDIALKDAESLAKSRGARGNIASLEIFEKTERINKPRLDKIGLKADALARKVRSGEIRFDTPSLERLSVPQRREFLNSLDAPAKGEYIKQYPEVFRSIDIQGQDTRSSGKSLLKNLDGISSAMDSMENTSLSVPSLYAVAAIPCISLAKKKEWANLALCIAKVSSQAQAAYNNFKSCWDSAKKWEVFKKAACLAEFIAKLA
jgi:hypothetical protein